MRCRFVELTFNPKNIRAGRTAFKFHESNLHELTRAPDEGIHWTVDDTKDGDHLIRWTRYDVTDDKLYDVKQELKKYAEGCLKGLLSDLINSCIEGEVTLNHQCCANCVHASCWKCDLGLTSTSEYEENPPWKIGPKCEQWRLDRSRVCGCAWQKCTPTHDTNMCALCESTPEEHGCKYDLICTRDDKPCDKMCEMHKRKERK